MVEAVCGYASAVLGLGEDESALDDGLRVKREAHRSPVGMEVVLAHGIRDVGFECRGMLGDAPAAGVPNGWMRLVDFLDGGAGEAGEVGQFALQDRFAEIHVGEQAIEGIRQGSIAGRCKHALGPGSPVLGCGECEVFLALEVVEEAALGKPGRFANVLDPCGCIAFSADDVQCRVEKPGLRFVSCIGFRHGIY